MTIKRASAVIDAAGQDSFPVGGIYEVSPNLAMMLIAAGWARSETRHTDRRDTEEFPIASYERRQMADRRTV